jgi:hypothetical protein
MHCVIDQNIKLFDLLTVQLAQGVYSSLLSVEEVYSVQRQFHV